MIKMNKEQKKFLWNVGFMLIGAINYLVFGIYYYSINKMKTFNNITLTILGIFVGFVIIKAVIIYYKSLEEDAYE